MKKSYLSYCSLVSLNRRMADLIAAADVVEKTYAPPATVFLHALQLQIPTQVRFIDSYTIKKKSNLYQINF